MADVLDYEAGAATLADLAPWAAEGAGGLQGGGPARPAVPAIYASASKLTEVCNALQTAGITGIGLWVANWSEGRAAAVAQVEQASGPYPVIGVQWADAGTHDLDVFSAAWVNARTVRAVAEPPPGPVGGPERLDVGRCDRDRHRAGRPGPRVRDAAGRPVGAAG